MRRTVLSIAYPFAPVGSRAVGGAEQILTDLDQALVAVGHTSLVVACEGSEAAGQLFPAPMPSGVLDEADRLWARKRYQAAIDRALASRPVDLVHFHGLDFADYTIPEHIPVLVTLHMPPSWYPDAIWSGVRENVLLQCVSESQRFSCPAGFEAAPVVGNGVALPLLSGAPVEDFALALGRICPEKNLHAAFDAGTLAGTRVLLGGQTFPYRTHLDYFEREIATRVQPQATGPRHEFLGPLSPDRKRDLLQCAKCLLLPTLAPETSSLVAMEALAAGTPVIAFRSGALSEIVDDGVTGFLVDSVESMAEAIGNIGAIDRRVCRQTAERSFSLDRMISGYFALYERHIADVGRRRCYA